MQKIIIADQNRLLREMLTKAISANENLEIINILHSYDFLFHHVQKSAVDWVIISLPDGSKKLPTVVKEILINYPEIGVLIVSPDGSRVRVKWLEPHERVLDGINLDELIDLLSDSLDSEKKNSDGKNISYLN